MQIINHGFVPMRDIPGAVESFLEDAAPWDETNQPDIVTWDSLEPVLLERAAQRKKLRESGICDWPWAVAKHFGIDYKNPYQRTTDCAGFAGMPDDLILKQMGLGARLKYHNFNPSPSWYFGRADANFRGGGATLGMVLKAINKYGCYPVDIAGPYETQYGKGASYWEKIKPQGEPYQVSCCYIGDLSAENQFYAINLAGNAGCDIEIGSNRVMGKSMSYRNGFKEYANTGSGMHATRLIAARTVAGNSNPFLFEKGSWGNYYPNGSQEREDTPTCGAWGSPDSLYSRIKQRYFDAFILVYAESTPSESDWNLAVPQIAFPGV